MQLEIGLGDAKKIDKVVITWPNMTQSQTVLKDLEMKKFYLIKENAEKRVVLDKKVLNFD